MEREELLKYCKVIEESYTPIVSDILDEMGYRDQVMTEWFHQVSLTDKIAGPAYTLEFKQESESYNIGKHELSVEEIIVKIKEVFDAMDTGDVIVGTTNGSFAAGVWGEIMSTIAKYHYNARGAILDGAIRDVHRTEKVGFPVWFLSTIPTEAVGRIEYLGLKKQIWCGGRLVRREDIVFADRNGVIIIPKEIDLKELTDKIRNNTELEEKTRNEIQEGSSPFDVYRKYQVI
jgi:4-hydroxy-4-methyl-2-oxoglutarate aldolase